MRTLALVSLLLPACGSPNRTAVPEARATTHSPDRTVATWSGGQLTMADVEAKVQTQLDAMEQEYQLERHQLLSQALDGTVDEALLQARADKGGHADIDALLAAEIESGAAMPTEEQLRAFYEEVRDQLRGAPYDAVQSMLAAELMQRQMAERYRGFIGELRREAKVKASIPYPDLKRLDVTVASTDPVLGDRDAPVQIVQFAEYQCYFCNKVSPTLRSLVDDYDGKVAVVFKDFPLDNHPRAMPAAVAARCAGDQDQYWPMNALLLANQQALSDTDFTGYAAQLGLDGDAFAACLSSGKHDDAIRAAYGQGQALGVAATPTFYVNGILVSGAQPYDVFKELVDQELAKR